MSSPISRRHVLAAPLALAGCASASPYFGNTTAPRRQTLMFALGSESDTRFKYAWIDTNWRPYPVRKFGKGR